ncbi:LLM class flavin-dependent oxidoreductase [Corynebacterium sp. TAE3-ERU30]|uniref:LLM class flavin-dependent oxidoreductase n=1 Tax=Corynebacterium sp. TAE3-ERU30 TaxID=2849496 RepID=UPI0021055CB9|nr:LLM class flavin-dependent oxidoreductase [Corynebacterium sp. TAE3-ERU30]
MRKARMIPLSLIDFALVYDGERPRDSFSRSVRLAQRAEKLGYERIWYAEHHNMPRIASSAPAVLIAHVGAHTSTIKLGAGGVMLPNHAPLVIAEQFGALEEMYPGRIGLGLGRAPGTDQRTVQALRRSPRAAERFPEDVAEVQGYLSGESRIPGVQAIPGAATEVPLYILGSSLFGAQLAAQLGLPYAFASHFAPQHLDEAIAVYRERYQPSAVNPNPYVIAAVNVTAADTTAQAQEDWEQVRRSRVKSLAARGRELSEKQLDALLHSYAGQQVSTMMRYTAIGTKPEVRSYLSEFQERTGADELMISLQSPSHAAMLHAMEILSAAWELPGADPAL